MKKKVCALLLDQERAEKEFLKSIAINWWKKFHEKEKECLKLSERLDNIEAYLVKLSGLPFKNEVMEALKTDMPFSVEESEKISDGAKAMMMLTAADARVYDAACKFLYKLSITNPKLYQAMTNL